MRSSRSKNENQRMKALAILVSFISSVLFVSCASGSFTSLDKLRTEAGSENAPTASAYPDDDAVVLSEVHDVKATIDKDNFLETDERVTMIVKLFRNISDYSSVELTIHNGERLESISARTIRPDGSVVTLKPGDFHSISGDEGEDVFYSDARKVKFTFKGIDKDCIIEYSYRVHSMYAFVQDVWDIQSEIPILENVYRLTVPVMLIMPTNRGGYGWNWRYQAFNCTLGDPKFDADVSGNGFELQLGKTNGTVTLEWKRSHIPAFRPEPMMPPYSNYIQYVKFARSEWTTWNAISQWYYEYYFKPQYVVTNEVSAKARSITKDCPTEMDKLKAVYAYIQTLRYVAVEIGQGGYRPAKPEQVLERGYGDCKDKSMLLLSLLKSLGIDARPALVRTEDRGQVSPDFPCWEFNHMIVYVKTRGGRGIWLDPTVDYCPVGEIPYEDEGIYALVLNGNGTSLLKWIPTDSYTANLEEQDITIGIGKGNNVNYDIALRFTGQQDFGMRTYLGGMSRDEITNFFRSLVAVNYLNAQVMSYSVSDLDSVASPLVLRFKLRIPNAAERQGDLLFVDPDPLRPNTDWTWLSADKRRYPVEFDYPRAVQKTIELDFPREEYSLETAPGDTTLVMDGLYYTENSRENGSSPLTLSRSFCVRYKVIDAKYFDQMKDFIASMRRLSAEGIVLRKK